MNTQKRRLFNSDILHRIIQFYTNATFKYPIYTVDDAIKDATAAYNDMTLLDTDKTLPRWEMKAIKFVVIKEVGILHI